MCRMFILFLCLSVAVARPHHHRTKPGTHHENHVSKSSLMAERDLAVLEGHSQLRKEKLNFQKELETLWSTAEGEKKKLVPPKDFKCCPCMKNTFSWESTKNSSQECETWVANFVIKEYQGFCKHAQCTDTTFLPPSYSVVAPQFYGPAYFYDAPGLPGKRFQYKYAMPCDPYVTPCPTETGGYFYKGETYNYFPFPDSDFGPVTNEWPEDNYYNPGSGYYYNRDYGYNDYYYGRYSDRGNYDSGSNYVSNSPSSPSSVTHTPSNNVHSPSSAAPSPTPEPAQGFAGATWTPQHEAHERETIHNTRPGASSDRSGPPGGSGGFHESGHQSNPGMRMHHHPNKSKHHHKRHSQGRAKSS